MLAWLAPPIILSHETMHQVWGIVEWFANTLIFLLAGLIIGNRTLDNVNAIDWLYLFILYFALLVIRAVVVAILFPFISAWGHKCTAHEAVFLRFVNIYI